MNAVRPVLAAAVASIGLLPASGRGADPEVMRTQQIEPAVAASVQALAVASAPRRLLRASYRLDMSSQGSSTSTQAMYEALPNNMLGVDSVLRTAGGASQVRAISLCGLFDLVGASTAQARSEVQVPVAVPIKGLMLFMPMGMTIGSNFSFRSRVTQFTVAEDSRQICSRPAPGSSFGFTLQTENTFGNGTSRVHRVAWRCTAGQAASPGPLEPAWSGEQIPVECVLTDPETGKQGGASRFVYLVDAGVFMKQVSGAEPYRFTTTYSAIELSP